MTDSIFEMVEEFNREILEIEPRPVGLQDEDEFELSIIQLQEELGEFIEAYENKDVYECIDGLLDLMYFASGVAYKMGVGHEKLLECFKTIHAANMAKAKGKKEARGFDGSAADATKPTGWEAPNLERIISGS